MKRTNKTGCTCVGELRLSSLDVGFDLRDAGTPVSLPDAFSSVGIEENGEVFLVEGTRAEMVAAIRSAGYAIKNGVCEDEIPCAWCNGEGSLDSNPDGSGEDETCGHCGGTGLAKDCED